MRTPAVIRTFIGSTVLGFVAVGFVPSVASAQTADLTVSASVSRNCTITATAISFVAYDPVVANATANLDGQGNVRVACTKGVAPTIALGTGSHASGSSRQLAAGTDMLTYELYQNSTHSSVWGSSGGGVLTVPAATSRVARDFPVYGRIPGGQDVPAGAYSDTIVATVNF